MFYRNIMISLAPLQAIQFQVSWNHFSVRTGGTRHGTGGTGLAINDTEALEYLAFIKVVITNVMYNWGKEWQLLCWFWELSFTSHSIRIRIWTVRSWNWKPSSVQFNFLAMASKQYRPFQLKLSTKMKSRKGVEKWLWY